MIRDALENPHEFPFRKGDFVAFINLRISFDFFAARKEVARVDSNPDNRWAHGILEHSLCTMIP